MKKIRLRKFVLPTVYVMVIGVLFVSISILGNVLSSMENYDNMTVSALKDNVTPVISDDEVAASEIVKPFIVSSVSISKSFYDMTDDAKKQEDSLVYYENTYMQNSGVLYESNEEFEVISSTDGTVSNVATDEILGEYVEITYNQNLKLVYYGLKDVGVKKGDAVVSGDVLGKSGNIKLADDSKYSLLFEVYQSGIAIDPEDFYNMNINDFK